jgi:hypothetical protein
MRFRHLPVSDAATTANFEQLQNILPDGVLDERYLRVAASSEIVFGAATAEWTVKGFASAPTKVATGLVAVTVGFAQVAQNTGQFGTSAVAEGANLAVTVRDNEAEIAIGVKVTFYWLALGK